MMLLVSEPRGKMAIVQVVDPILGCRRKKFWNRGRTEEELLSPAETLAVADMLKLSPLATMEELAGCSHHE